MKIDKNTCFAVFSHKIEKVFSFLSKSGTRSMCVLFYLVEACVLFLYKGTLSSQPS